MEIDRQKKAEVLQRTIKHIDITAHDPRALIDAYKEMSFSARELGRACEIYERMLQDDRCTIILTIAGSTSAAGCMQTYVDLLRHNMVDIVVATGATVVDMDFFEALGFSHYRGSAVRRRRAAARPVHRSHLRHLHRRGGAAALRQDDQGDRRRAGAEAVLVARVHRARWAAGWRPIRRARSRPSSLVQVAYELGVPVFCPAFSDSSAGFGLVAHQAERPDAPHQHRFGARLSRADPAQDRRRGHRPADDRRRLAQELRAGYRGLRRDPGPRCADAQIQHPDHGRRHARRRLLELQPQGGHARGARSTLRPSRWCSPRRRWRCLCWRPTAITAAAGRSGPGVSWQGCSMRA